MELGTVLASCWSAGISLYAVVAALGIAGRIGWIQTSELIQQPWFLAIAIALAVVDLVVDKISLLDTVWDAAHTVIRPLGGAAIGWLAPEQMVGPDLPDPVVLALTGGGLALSSHVAKASLRAAVNTSPEPVSNVVVSLLEDGLVVTVLAVALAYPAVAAALTALLVLVSVVISVVAYRVARRAWRRVRRTRSSSDDGHPPRSGVS